MESVCDVLLPQEYGGLLGLHVVLSYKMNQVWQGLTDFSEKFSWQHIVTYSEKLLPYNRQENVSLEGSRLLFSTDGRLCRRESLPATYGRTTTFHDYVWRE